MAVTPDYRVVVYNYYHPGLGRPAIDEIVPKNLQYGYVLNGPGSISFTLPNHDPKCKRSTFEPGARELEVYRGDDLVWGGYLWSAQAEQEGVMMRFGGEGVLSRLFRRHIDQDKIYTGADQTTGIFKDLINFAQSGWTTHDTLGISTSSITASGVLRDRTYLGPEQKNIGEALRELAAVQNGFDFDIDPEKVARTYYPRKQSGNIPTFELGKNIRGYGYILDASDLCTVITATGDGITVNQTDPDASLDTQYGRLVGIRNFPGVKESATLTAHAKEELRLAKRPQLQPQLQVYTADPPFGSYGVGDLALLKIDDGYVQIDGEQMRITALNVAVSDEGQEAIGLFFGEEGQLAPGETTSQQNGSALTTFAGTPTNVDTHKLLDALNEGAQWAGRVPVASLVTVGLDFRVAQCSSSVTVRLRVRRTSGTPADIVSDFRTFTSPSVTGQGLQVAFPSTGGNTYTYIVEISALSGTAQVYAHYMTESIQV